MKKHFYIFLLITCFANALRSQVDSVYYGTPQTKEKKKAKEKPPINWREHTSFGGNFMIWFGSTTYIYLSPTVNYAVNKRLNIGLGGIYNYYSQNQGAYKYSTSVYGLHSYGLFYVTNNVFVKAQYDHLLQPNYYSPYPNEKIWVGYLLLGGGFKQQLGDHAVLLTSLLYNVNESRYSIYPNPIIQIGIFAGF